jgi:putative intracellular protease/amidase
MFRSLLFVVCLFACFLAFAGERVLLVVSSAGTPEDPESGYEFDELTQAWWAFVDNGYDVEIASPSGGEPQSEERNPMWSYNSRFLEDPVAMAAVANTTALSDVDANEFDAIFLVGGSGASIDLPHDSHLQQLVADVYLQGGVIGAVCHGPAGLVNVEIDGESFLQGRTLTAFTNEEEALFGDKEGKGWSLEDRIVAEGGRFEEADIMGLKVVSDGRLVTGQNPFSTALTAEATIQAMGRTPAKREAYISENTMALASEALVSGLAPAASKLAAAPESYQPMFIALLGYYRAMAATAEEEIRKALTLMSLSLPYFQHDNIDLVRAGAHEKLGELDTAREILTALVERSPELDAAREQLAALAD